MRERSGQDAAAISGILPAVDGNYLLNGCPIASVNCGVLDVRVISISIPPVPTLLLEQGPPFILPRRDLDIGSIFNPRDDEDLLLPLVSDQVY